MSNCNWQRRTARITDHFPLIFCPPSDPLSSHARCLAYLFLLPPPSAPPPILRRRAISSIRSPVMQRVPVSSPVRCVIVRRVSLRLLVSVLVAWLLCCCCVCVVVDGAVIQCSFSFICFIGTNTANPAYGDPAAVLTFDTNSPGSATVTDSSGANVQNPSFSGFTTPAYDPTTGTVTPTIPLFSDIGGEFSDLVADTTSSTGYSCTIAQLPFTLNAAQTLSGCPGGVPYGLRRRVPPTRLLRFANQVDRSVTQSLPGRGPRRHSPPPRHGGGLFASYHPFSVAYSVECGVVRCVAARRIHSRRCYCHSLSLCSGTAGRPSQPRPGGRRAREGGSR